MTGDLGGSSENGLDECIAILDNPEDGYGVRRKKIGACKKLGDMGGEEAAIALAGAMMDDKVAEYAMVALTKIDEQRAVALFKERLRIERGNDVSRNYASLVRAMFLRRSGDYGNFVSVPAIEYMNDEENINDVFDFVMEQLREISQISDGSHPITNLWGPISMRNWVLMDIFVASLTREYSNRAIPTLTELFYMSGNLGSWKKQKPARHSSLRHCIIDNLHGRERNEEGGYTSNVIRGNGSLSLIKSGFRDKGADVRISAAKALSIISGDDVRNDLIEGLVDRSENVVFHCISGLKGIGDRESVAALIRSLKSNRVATREEVALTLGIIGEDVAVPHLIEALKDPNQGVRSCVCKALGRIGSERALDALTEMKEDESWKVRHDSFVARHRILGNIDSDYKSSSMYSEIGFLAEQEIEFREIEQIIHLILEYGGGLDILAELVTRREDLPSEYLDQIIEEFVGYFDSKTRSHRKYAVNLLTPIGTRLVPILLSHLEGSSWRVRDSIAESLGEIGGSVSLKALRSLLDDKDEDVRQTASKAMERIEQQGGG